MFVVITASFRLLYAMIVLSHDRRRIIHFGVTDRPNQDWLSGEISKALKPSRRLHYLIRDRDAAYGARFSARLQAMGIQELITKPRSPWENSHVERAILSIRRECLNHVIIFNRDHLLSVLSSYINYYNRSRTHQSLNKDCPVHRPIDSSTGEIVTIPEVGGLHHRYERRAA
jgi:transposase InsO family protein